MGLCSVLDVGDVVFLTPVDQPIVTHLPVEMHGDDGFGVGRSCRFKPGEVNAPVVGFDVYKDGCRPRQRHARRRGNVGHGRDEHLVAWSNVKQTQGCPQRNGTALTGRALDGVAVGGKLTTERLALRALHPVQRIKGGKSGFPHFFVPRRSSHRNAFHASACLFSSLSVRFHRLPHRAFEDPCRCSAFHGVA